ncbi:MAG: NAD(P)/FAD-dependent oxidoreductase, partial [Polynucleobacter sp.]
KIAVIGAGISGLGCAYALSKLENVELTIYEGGDHIGGHSNTVDLTLDTSIGPVTHGIDTGFLVFNQRTYPRLLRLFHEIDAPIAKSDMSFSVSIPNQEGQNLEWAGTDLNSLFAQRENLFNLNFLVMVKDIIRFNSLCTKLALNKKLDELNLTVGEFIKKHGFSKEFQDWYFLPMVGAIWSCPVEQMLEFPISTMIRFCHNHGLIKITDRPQWLTVSGGSKEYVKRICEKIKFAGGNFKRLKVKSIKRLNNQVQVFTDQSSETYDQVVMATHSDETLQLLADPSSDERSILSSINYQQNRAVLHTDASVLPQEKRCWAAWNYTTNSSIEAENKRVCVNYLINKLQPLPESWNNQPIIVSLNPVIEPASETIRADIEYAHPIFDEAAINAQSNLPLIQGSNNTWFCGAWTGYGFHEDGLRSGELVAEAIHELLIPHNHSSALA